MSRTTSQVLGSCRLQVVASDVLTDFLMLQVWVGIEYPAAAGADLSSQTSNLKVREQRHRKTARQKGLDSQPSLPSLVVADVAVLPD